MHRAYFAHKTYSKSCQTPADFITCNNVLGAANPASCTLDEEAEGSNLQTISDYEQDIDLDQHDMNDIENIDTYNSDQVTVHNLRRLSSLADSDLIFHSPTNTRGSVHFADQCVISSMNNIGINQSKQNLMQPLEIEVHSNLPDADDQQLICIDNERQQNKNCDSISDRTKQRFRNLFAKASSKSQLDTSCRYVAVKKTSKETSFLKRTFSPKIYRKLATTSITRTDTGSDPIHFAEYGCSSAEEMVLDEDECQGI